MILSEANPRSFPLVSMQMVTNADHDWIGIAFHFEENEIGCMPAFVHLYDEIGLRDAPDGLMCMLDAPILYQGGIDLLQNFPRQQLVLRVSAALGAAAEAQMDDLQTQGFHLMFDGLPVLNAALSTRKESLAIDCDQIGESETSFWRYKLAGSHPGPHLATDVNSATCFNACRSAGFSWFVGDYPLHPSAGRQRNDGTSRFRLLTLLALVARDANSCDLEVLFKQDPALSYSLLKLVSAAAYARSGAILSFSQAINVLGRRQLQRWLQLLLYARQEGDSAVNPLLPLAALRAGLMESLSQQTGGDRDEADRAFMVGMFSLLDALFAMPLAEILAPLDLPKDVMDALQNRSGRLGALLDVAEHAYSGNLPLLRANLMAGKIDIAIFYCALVHAYAWAIQASGRISHDIS